MAGSNESALFVAGSLRRTWRNAGVPTNGTSGTYAAVVDIGDLLIDTTNGLLFQNTGTQASPIWSRVVTSGPTLDKTASEWLDANDQGIIRAYTDAIYFYLPTYLGNEGLLYIFKVMASHSSGVEVRAASVAGATIDGAASKTSAAQYDTLAVRCSDVGDWNVLWYIGTWT